jgi:predicted ATPase
MFDLALKDFRGFHDTEFARIRPITILIGENSTGKSSFLAAIKYFVETTVGGKVASFNEAPFQLGTFQQIAHYRGGKAGRAKEFKIITKYHVNYKKDNKFVREPMTYVLKFFDSESTAAIREISIANEEIELFIRFDSSKIGAYYRIYQENGIEGEIQGFLDDVGLENETFLMYWPFLALRMASLEGINISNYSKAAQPIVVEKLKRLLQNAKTFTNRLRGGLDVGSAIRTKPLRTYTPGLESKDGEGSHVPFEMARLARSKNREAWNKLKDRIDNFGISSGMFKEISIKSFGNSISDPFQLQFSLDGPKTNIVDLGYGTSQILPIIYNITTGSNGTTYLIQQPEVHLHPKAQAALGTYVVDAFRSQKKKFILETHSDFIVDRVRMAVMKKQLRPSDVSILYFERRRLENIVTSIKLDETGSTIDPPDGYRSFFLDEQLSLLGLQ